MLKRFLVSVLVVAAALFTPLQLIPRVVVVPTAHADRYECIVYITRTGARYHVDGCRYLRQSRIAVTKKEAEARGYTPCRVCGGSTC